jgi:hypothetical protein
VPVWSNVYVCPAATVCELVIVRTTLFEASTTVVVSTASSAAAPSFCTLVMIRTVAEASLAETVVTYVPQFLTTEYTFKGTCSVSVMCIHTGRTIPPSA